MSIIHIPFTTVKEDYNEYRLQNNQILRVKSTPVDFIQADKELRVVYREVSYIITPDTVDRSGLMIGDPATVTEQDEIESVQFKPIKEVINVYETEHSMIYVTSKVERIASTRKKDVENNPILRYTMKTLLNISLKPTSEPIKQELKAAPRVWMFRKRGTSEGVVAYKKANYFVWAKTYEDKITGDYVSTLANEFEDMINKENYDIDENTFFTFTNQGFKFIKRNSPFDKSQ
jgi:hypothetical protein